MRRNTRFRLKGTKSVDLLIVAVAGVELVVARGIDVVKSPERAAVVVCDGMSCALMIAPPLIGLLIPDC